MSRTLGYHVVKSAYGTWLPGDQRGHWSKAWDVQIGFQRPHMLNPGDPVRLRMAMEQMTCPPVRFDRAMIDAIANSLADLIAQSKGGLTVAAAAIEPTHMHLCLPYTGREIDHTVRWLADQTTKAVHRQTGYRGPVWCRGKWRTYISDPGHWHHTIRYVREHNLRAGRPADPYPWITPID